MSEYQNALLFIRDNEMSFHDFLLDLIRQCLREDISAQEIEEILRKIADLMQIRMTRLELIAHAYSLSYYASSIAEKIEEISQDQDAHKVLKLLSDIVTFLYHSKDSSLEISFVNSETYERSQLKNSDFVSDDFIAALNEQLKAKTVSYKGNIGMFFLNLETSAKRCYGTSVLVIITQKVNIRSVIVIL